MDVVTNARKVVANDEEKTVNSADWPTWVGDDILLYHLQVLPVLYGSKKERVLQYYCTGTAAVHMNFYRYDIYICSYCCSYS